MLYDIILPISIDKILCYDIPQQWLDTDVIGCRVLVSLRGQKIYTGIVYRKHSSETEDFKVETILCVIDDKPFISSEQLKLWDWLSEYYICSLGDIMRSAVIASYRLESETKILLTIDSYKIENYTDTTAKIINILSDNKVHNIGEIQKKTDIKNIHQSLSILIDDGIVTVYESATEREKRKDKIQTNGDRDNNLIKPKSLTIEQTKAKNQIKDLWKDKSIVLLYGVTGSGKTEVYSNIITDELNENKQILYLVPEIALTTQLKDRLKEVFGKRLFVYHSRATIREKQEIYKKLQAGESIVVLGTRSAVFLPFRHLGIVIVDEEHDSSYKQQETSPRYNARTVGIMLTLFSDAKVLLGSATPSIETYYNCQTDKYGLVKLTERYTQIPLPRIHYVNTNLSIKKRETEGHFDTSVLDKIRKEISLNNQTIIFINRRGYSPYVECKECAYIPKCINCDVSLTYHRNNYLICHYCGYSIKLPTVCPNCRENSLKIRGLGTERVEEELESLLPDTKIGRMDLDTTRGKNSYQKIIDDFEKKKFDILVGTQMVTKGLDFSSVNLVVVLNSDYILNSSDFRSSERMYQLLEQVSGRSGRRQKQGEVYVQTTNPENPVYTFLSAHNYEGMYKFQLEERKEFKYPPFYRIIRLEILHNDNSIVENAAGIIRESLFAIFTHRCSRVITPIIIKKNRLYSREIILKFSIKEPMNKAKKLLKNMLSNLKENNKYVRQTKTVIDVDPE